MTEIDFYILNDQQTRLDFTAKLCHKVFSLGHRIFVCTDTPEQSQQLSEQLWSMRPDSFLANEIIDTTKGPNNTKSPIKISHNICDESAPLLDNDVLINLTLSIPPHFSRYKRGVEIIAGDEKAKEKLRENYSFYKQRGYPLKMHDLRKK